MNDRKLYRFLILVLLLGAVTSLARAQFSQIYTFNGNVDGDTPYFANLLAQGTDGYVYGTLPAGARWGDGSWFQDVPGSFPTFLAMAGNGTTLPDTGVYNPYAGFTLGIDGNYYSAAVHGGLPTGNGSTYGLIFKMSGGAVTPIYDFTGGTGGSYPYAPPVQGTDGNLYGVTCDPASTGHVYQILTSTTPATLGWIRPLPSCSRAPLFLASDGNLYGTYPYGSFLTKGPYTYPSGGGYGGVFGITYSGAVAWYYNMNPFSTNNSGYGDGSTPWGGVIQASDGNLYGANSSGGAYGTPAGVLYEIGLNGTGYTVIHNFQNSDGTSPNGGLVQGSDGNLYGLTAYNGVLSSQMVQAGFSPTGTIFRVSLSGANYSRLYTFSRYYATGQGSGSHPYATPMLHTSGDFYGLTYDGGFSTNGATSGSQSGSYDDGGELFKYRTAMAPFINTVNRRYGRPGTLVSLIGQGFLNTTNVTFGGASVAWGSKWAVMIWSDTYMTVTVPNFAHTGPIVVYETNGNGVQTTLSTTYNFRICSLLSSCP